MLRKSIALMTLVLTLVVWGCNGTGLNPTTESKGLSDGIEAIATVASEGVGAVGESSRGTKGSPVIVLEERHNSRAGQIQHAITLVRLHDKNGLRDIALEGYLKERPKINTDWFTKAWPGQEVIDRARVAVRLLKEGEISAAEFMKLVYEDVTLHAIEKESEYDVAFTDGAMDAFFTYLTKINTNRARDIANMYNDVSAIKSTTGEQHLEIAEEIEKLAVQKSIKLTPQQRKDWESWLAFWRGRIGGSKTMFDATSEIANHQAGPLIAMNVGAFHTDGICKMLGKSDRSFAVIKPLAMKNEEEQGDLKEGFDRKYKRLSVFSEGFLANRLQSIKKPEPVLDQPWFKAKTGMYQYTDRIVNRLLPPSSGGAAPPSGPPPGQPPFGFSDDDFRKEGVPLYIDPRKIEIIPDALDSKRKAVLIPVLINPNNPARRTMIWIKAARGEGSEQGLEMVEALLKNALSEVKSEEQAPTRTEDAAGRIQMSTTTVAAVGSDKEAVRRAVLIGI